METLYNKTGKPIAYIYDDKEHIYLYNGKAVGYLKNDSVYSFSGRYLGWIYNSWFYDRKGKPTFFTENSSGGPVKPVRKVKPVKGVRKVKPVKSVREIKPVKPVRSLNWSELSNENYFIQ